MKAKSHSYRTLIEKEQQGEKAVYVTYAPTLGISDFGKTIEEATQNIEKAMQLYIETLIDLKQPVPEFVS